jgi:rubredoxin
MRRHAFRPFGGDHVAVIHSEDVGHDASCLADEVVIDFPSVASAIDRIRSAFVADERPTPLAAWIELSPDDAVAGATVPLEVPVHLTCRGCGGRGENWAESCARCAGTGFEVLPHQLQVTMPAGVSHGDRFHFTVTARHNPPTRIELHILVR